jgi:hypothetical protein
MRGTYRIRMENLRAETSTERWQDYAIKMDHREIRFGIADK